MKKVIGFRKVKASALALTFAAALTLTGCNYTGDLIHDFGSITKELSNNKIDNSVSIPKSIDPLEFEDITIVEKSTEKFGTDKERKEQIASLNILDDLVACLVYTSDDKHIYYSSDFMKKIITEDYIAYYNALDGKLQAIEVLNIDNINVSLYKSYIANKIVELGPVENELYNPNYSDFIFDGIDFDNNTITRKAYVYMELGYLGKHTETVHEIVDGLYKEKGLK